MVEILIIGLVAYRLWRIIGKDSITAGLRDRLDRHPRLDDFIGCPWCLGFWITGAVTAFAYWTGSVEDWLFTWLAASVVVGLLGRVDS